MGGGGGRRAAVLIEVAELSTPLGPLHLALADGRLCALAFAEGWARACSRLQRRFPDGRWVRSPDPGGVAGRLRAYFDGQVQALEDLEVDADGTLFQRRVWAAMRSVEPGATITYGELARRVEVPGGGRAVGAAAAANPVAIAVPCHRVVGASGRLGGYGGGLRRKRWLLEHERRFA